MKDLSKGQQKIVEDLVHPEKDAFIEWYTDEFNHDWKLHDLRNKPKIAEETIKTIKKLKSSGLTFEQIRKLIQEQENKMWDEINEEYWWIEKEDMYEAYKELNEPDANYHELGWTMRLVDSQEGIEKDKSDKLRKINKKMSKLSISPSKIAEFGIKIAKDGVLRSSNEILNQKGVDMAKIREIWPEIPYFNREIDEQIEINAHYRGYLRKQKADILAFKRDENLIIPNKINYDDLSGLSNEVKSKFRLIKPKTMGQALRIDGITPAAVYILLSHVKRKSIKHIA